MTCKLLVQSLNKSLEIVDLYFGYKDGVDTITTGHPAVRKFNNSKLQDDPEWVDGVFEKLELYETELSVKQTVKEQRSQQQLAFNIQR